jgi:hypothetical protein
MTETTPLDERERMLRRIRDRAVGTDPVLEQRSLEKPATLKIVGQTITRLETMTKKGVTDAGEEIIHKGFVEREACLITISNWDLVQDEDLCMRSQIVPALEQFGLDPKMAVVLQFLDSNGKPMKHVASGRPKAVMAGGR